MRKIGFIGIGLFVHAGAHTTITKGSVLLGGNAGINSQTQTSPTGETKSSSWSFNPVIGLAIKNNTVLGVTASFLGASQSPTVYHKNTGYGGGVFLRRYKPLGKWFYLFGGERLLQHR